MVRVLQHIPVGLVNVALLVVSPALGVLFGLGFVGYQVLQSRGYDWEDKSHKDLKGWLWGLGIGGAGWSCVVLLGLW